MSHGAPSGLAPEAACPPSTVEVPCPSPQPHPQLSQSPEALSPPGCHPQGPSTSSPAVLAQSPTQATLLQQMG